MDIEQINPRNEPALAAWHATVVAADRHGRQETATPWQLPEVQATVSLADSVARKASAMNDTLTRWWRSGGDRDAAGLALVGLRVELDLAQPLHDIGRGLGLPRTAPVAIVAGVDPDELRAEPRDLLLGCGLVCRGCAAHVSPL